MKPIAIKANKETKVLSIEWNDAHESHFSFELLRAACPCATCRGGHENMKPEPDEGVYFKRIPAGPMTQLDQIELVGEYAFTINWGDGHHYGIYNWHYLRKLCNCEICRKELK